VNEGDGFREAVAQVEKRFEDFKEAVKRELDEFKAAVWVELGTRREARWRTATLFVAVGCALLSTMVAITLALFGGGR